MAGIFQTACGTTSVNTGLGSCRSKLTQVTNILILRGGYKMALTQFTAESFAESLEPAIISRSIMPILNVSLGAPAGGDVLTQEVSGKTEYVSVNQYQNSFNLNDASLCLIQELEKMNHANISLIFIDANGKLMFKTDGVNAFGFTPYDLFFTKGNPSGTAHGESNKAMMMFSMDYEQFGVGFSIIDMPFLVTDIKGILSTDMLVTNFDHTTTVGTITVKVVESCNQNVGVRSLDKESFKVVQGGVTIDVTSATESTTTDGLYTILATMDDASFDIVVTPISGALYAGSASYTVTPSGS